MDRVGNQRPTFERVGEYARTEGDEALEVFGAYGIGFDDAQAYQMRLYLAKDGRGEPASIQIALSVPRQNGKSYAARWYAVWCAAVCGKEVIYSAHNGDTVDEFFRMLCRVFEDGEYPDFTAMLSGAPYKQPGRQVISFVSGGRIRFNTRTNNKIRGGTVAVIIVDEAQELTEAQYNALLPAASAAQGGTPPQVVMVGTPPDPTCLGTVFARLHRAAHEAESPRDAWWLEWAAPEMLPENASPEDAITAAYETNPALGARITERAVRNEFATMTRDGFARERLGWWCPAGAVERLIDAAKWDKLAIPDEAAPEGQAHAFGVKFAADGRHVALSAAFAERGGRSYVELIDIRPTAGGIAWLRDLLAVEARGCKAVAIDGKAGASTLAAALAECGIPRRAVVEVQTGQAIAAAALLLEEVEGLTTSHIESPALDESAKGSIRRRIGSNGGFGFGDGPDSTSLPVESAALALWAARTSKRDPKRKQAIW